MTYLTEEIKEVAEKADLWMISTINDDGSPRTVPVHFKKILSDDEVMLVNNFMTTTLNNLEARPDKVSLTLWSNNVWHLRGGACVLSSGEIFQQGVEIVKAKRPNLNPKSVILFKVNSVQVWRKPQ